MSARNISAATRAALAEVKKLRADLERVEKERDNAKLAGEAALVHSQRELAETKSALEESKAFSDMWNGAAATWERKCLALDTELDQLQRAWALRELSEPELLTDAYVHTLPESVAALVRRYAGICVGPCADCNAQAPLKQVAGATMNDPDKLVCAWGCSEKGPSDGG